MHILLLIFDVYNYQICVYFLVIFEGNLYLSFNCVIDLLVIDRFNATVKEIVELFAVWLIPFVGPGGEGPSFG